MAKAQSSKKFPPKKLKPKARELKKRQPENLSIDKLFLFDLLSQPTSPYREKFAISCLTTRLRAFKVPHFLDPIGNIVIGVKNKTDYIKLLKQKSKSPLRFFVAHADHPGFHGAKWLNETTLQCKWFGGSPTADLLGADVWLCNDKGDLVYSSIVEAQLIPSLKSIDSLTIKVPREFALQNGQGSPEKVRPSALFGGLSFRRPIWQEAGLIYTKAADDLVGAFSIVSLACALFRSPLGSKNTPPFIGLITRAEEVGFIGCIGHLELGWLKSAKRPILGISLETSRTFPGADIGKGPVVRLGDRTTVFDPGSLRVFTQLAERALPGKHQRRIMDGGSCEATALTAYGLSTIGISVPLGNYHNQNFEGGPDARAHLGPAPEFVHVDDIQGLLALCEALMNQSGVSESEWSNPWGETLKKLRSEFKKSKFLLKGC